MKTALIFSLLLAALVAQAAPRKAPVASPASPRAAAKSSKLSKDIRFSGSAVDGKYLSAGESIAEVEGDKSMGALVGVRKNFKDRLKTETARLQSAGKGN